MVFGSLFYIKGVICRAGTIYWYISIQTLPIHILIRLVPYPNTFRNHTSKKFGNFWPLNMYWYIPFLQYKCLLLPSKHAYMGPIWATHMGSATGFHMDPTWVYSPYVVCPDGPHILAPYRKKKLYQHIHLNLFPCLLCMTSFYTGGYRGDSCGSLKLPFETKLFHFHEEFPEKLA